MNTTPEQMEQAYNIRRAAARKAATTRTLNRAEDDRIREAHAEATQSYEAAADAAARVRDHIRRLRAVLDDLDRLADAARAREMGNVNAILDLDAHRAACPICQGGK